MEPVKGYLEKMERGFGFLRAVEKNFQPDPRDPFVPANLIRRHDLREGALIEGRGEPGDGRNRNLKLAAIERINGIPLADYADVALLQDRVSISPDERFILTQGPDDVLGRALDLIVPIGKGQRGLIISPPKAGKTTILKHMARSILQNHESVAVFVLLVDERPEEVTDFRRSLEDAHVLWSSSDQSISQQMRMTGLAINAAIRYAEAGMDTVMFIDSLTRMARGFNVTTRSHGRTLSGGLGANAMQVPRRIFGAARNLEGGGSLTIIATILVDTGSRMDDVIFQEFKGTGNMDLVLSRKCAEHRLWPAINIRQSGTRKEHLLLSADELKEAVDIRRRVSSLDEVDALAALLEYLKS